MHTGTTGLSNSKSLHSLSSLAADQASSPSHLSVHHYLQLYWPECVLALKIKTREATWTGNKHQGNRPVLRSQGFLFTQKGSPFSWADCRSWHWEGGKGKGPCHPLSKNSGHPSCKSEYFVSPSSFPSSHKQLCSLREGWGDISKLKLWEGSSA
jgi:hypothetical protein